MSAVKRRIARLETSLPAAAIACDYELVPMAEADRLRLMDLVMLAQLGRIADADLGELAVLRLADARSRPPPALNARKFDIPKERLDAMAETWLAGREDRLSVAGAA